MLPFFNIDFAQLMNALAGLEDAQLIFYFPYMYVINCIYPAKFTDKCIEN